MPPAAAYHCEYLANWVTVKTRWGMSVNQAEHGVLADSLAGCPDTTIEVMLAR
jgi:hypothetical protein